MNFRKKIHPKRMKGPIKYMKDFEKDAAVSLMSYRATKNAETGLREELSALEDLIRSLKACGREGAEPEKREDRRASGYIRSLLLRRDALKSRLLCCIAKRRSIERSLASLGTKERGIVEAFYVDPPEGCSCLDYCMEKFGYEKTHIYRLRAKGLREFAENMFGTVPDTTEQLLY